MTRTYSHWSDEPLGDLFPREQGTLPYFKPKGLWLSVDGADDWPAFCKKKVFRLDDFRHRAVVTLRPDANLIVLEDSPAMKGFTDLYQTPLPGVPEWAVMDRMFIDWQAVAEDFDGIVIPTYLWGQRFDRSTGWYYGWDCASGCIWQPRAIADIHREVMEDAG